MLNLGLSYLRVVEAYKINKELVPPKLICILFELVHLHLSFIEFLIGRRHVSSP